MNLHLIGSSPLKWLRNATKPLANQQRISYLGEVPRYWCSHELLVGRQEIANLVKGLLSLSWLLLSLSLIMIVYCIILSVFVYILSLLLLLMLLYIIIIDYFMNNYSINPLFFSWPFFLFQVGKNGTSIVWLVDFQRRATAACVILAKDVGASEFFTGDGGVVSCRCTGLTRSLEITEERGDDGSYLMFKWCFCYPFEKHAHQIGSSIKGYKNRTYLGNQHRVILPAECSTCSASYCGSGFSSPQKLVGKIQPLTASIRPWSLIGFLSHPLGGSPQLVTTIYKPFRPFEWNCCSYKGGFTGFYWRYREILASSPIIQSPELPLRSGVRRRHQPWHGGAGIFFCKHELTLTLGKLPRSLDGFI